MKVKPLSGKEIKHIQRYVLSAKRCCLIISLCILWDQFEVTVNQLKNAQNIFIDELKYYSAPWTRRALKRAKDEFHKVAKTYKGAELNGDLSKVGFDRNVSEWLWNTEATCLFVMLKILRTDFKATYKQLDFFIDKYDEFNKIYGEGKQASMQKLADELQEITGYDFFKGSN